MSTCYLLRVILLSNSVMSILVTNDTHVTIPGSVGGHVFTVGIFEGSYSWYQAESYCHQAGYARLANDLPSWTKVQALTEYLRESNYPAPASFWWGYFRPDPHISSWYKRSQCKEHAGVTAMIQAATCGGQCGVMYYSNTSGFDFPSLEARDCNLTYAFACIQSERRKDVVQYIGYSMNASDPELSPREYYNVTEAMCEGHCRDAPRCPVYDYNNKDGGCVVFRIPYGYGKVELNLTFTGENVTLGVLDGMYTIRNETALAATFGHVNNTLPDCNVSTVPANLCPCGMTQDTFQNLIVDMTIDPEKTAKSQQKFQCAEDNRPSSKAIGAMGIVVIVLVISVILFLDYGTVSLKPSPKTDMVKRLKQKKAE